MKKFAQLFAIYALVTTCTESAMQSEMGDPSALTSQALSSRNDIGNSMKNVNIKFSEDGYNNTTQNLPEQVSEDGLLNFTELSKKYIRPAEEYDVTTEDGYVLKLFRIPGNTSRVVLVCHGLLCSSDDFLIRGNISLFYMMASKGFDVWAMNCRGNRYSRSHVTLNPDTDRKFWQYSMHEVGIYDYKAVIDFILQKTGQKQLSVVAHSEGTSAFFILASLRPEYNKKVGVFIALAPVTNLLHSGPGMTGLLKVTPVTSPVQQILNLEEVLGYFSITKKVIDVLCTQGKVGYKFCFNILGILTGFNSENIEEDFASTIIGHFPAGTSRKTLLHYAANYYKHRFQQPDYGLKNFAVYGSLWPPVYDIKKVTTKVALFVAKGDQSASIEDAVRIKNELPNVVHYQVINDNKFNHIDYMWGRNAHEVLYTYVIELLFKYN